MKRTYKHFNNLVKNIHGEINLEMLLHKRAYFDTGKEKGWQSFNIGIDDDFYQEIVDLLGGHTKTKNRMKRTLEFHGSSLNHWGFSRIMYSKKRKKWKYVAGQDYTWELSKIRNYLKK